MRIESLWVKGFRSLRDVHLEDLGAFNVFYGPNGAGKSNILEAIRVFFRLAPLAMLDHVPEGDKANTAINEGIILRRDLCARDSSGRIVLGARLTEMADTSTIRTPDRLDLSALSLEVMFEWSTESAPKLSVSRLRAGDQDILESLNAMLPESASDAQIKRHRSWHKVFDFLRGHFVRGMHARYYGLIGAARAMRTQVKTSPPENEDALSWHLSERSSTAW